MTPTTYKLYVKAGGGYGHQDKQRYNGEAATFDGGLGCQRRHRLTFGKQFPH